MDRHNAFPKSQRLCERHLIDSLFVPGNSRSFTSYPLRLVISVSETADNQLMISVPKRCLRHAVDRNRVKRQVREAYRNNRRLLTLPEGQHVVMAMIWLDSHHYPSSKVTAKVCNLLRKASESLCAD
ncbi:MAG: ribonuclease P protein component [Prevotella sp.]|nr:ribonuclease P protein component [Prevotella sp.]